MISFLLEVLLQLVGYLLNWFEKEGQNFYFLALYFYGFGAF